MPRTRQNGAAAQTTPEGAAIEGAPTGAPPESELSPLALQRAVAALVELAVDVLRARHSGEATPVELPSVVSAQPYAVVDLEAAERAEPSLRALRSLLQDAADGIEPVAPTDGGARTAADALRQILEGIVRTRLLLPGDEARDGEPPTEAELEQGLAAAAELLPTHEHEHEHEPAVHQWTVRNLTARPLHLAGRDGIAELLPAFGERTSRVDPEQELDVRAELAGGEISIDTVVWSESTSYMALLGAYVWLVPIGVVVGSVWGWWAWVGSAAGLGALAAVVGLRQKGGRMARLRSALAEAPAWGMQTAMYLTVVLIGVVLPALAIVFGADLRTLTRHIVDLKASGSEYLTLVGRAMQLAFISIASLLPSLLYFQFDRDRLSTLREKFVHQIFRLDPTMRTQGAITAKYGRLIDEIYGPEQSARHRKLLPGRRAPIFVATLLIVLGWLYVLLNPEVGLTPSEGTIGELFVPRRSAVAFAFLGAYVFTLFALLRGYVRRDLRPKSYTDISVRILAVVILAWVLELTFRDDTSGLLGFAFLTGLVPQLGLNKIREMWLEGSAKRRARKDPAAAAFDDPLPLTDLEGIDLYDRTRLTSEGVTNIEALAHHDLIELMLQTRIPVPRLVDWTDQAILHLHVNDEDLTTLRSYGIRTATDLLSTRDRAEARKKLDDFLGILGAKEDGKPFRMQVILDAMEDEEWMENLRFWHGGVDRQSESRRSGGRDESRRPQGGDGD
jgi:hypothetical protein